jgi:two-component SAPR family response regulator
MESIKSGATGYVLKPITHAKLNKAIERNFPAWETEEV